MASRSSGLLLHLTSLPGPFGIGDLGPEAYRFVDLLAEAGQTVWQLLPLTPTGLGHSPYASPSTFAGNPLLISPEALAEEGWLTPDDLDLPALPDDRVDFERVATLKRDLLRVAYERACDHGLPDDFYAFCEHHADWLDDFALFAALQEHYDGAPWPEWPHALARRSPDALAAAHAEHAEAVELRRFAQFVFARQWERLHDYARSHGVSIFGDLPIYVAHDSADVWANRDLFHLNPDGWPTAVAGVPPDFFSATGQRWGNPLYRWRHMRERGYAWWTARLRHTLDLVDLVRLDHFRGFEAFWAIPADEETAINGKWVEGPGAALFDALGQALGDPLPLVAEDLGLITPEVRTLMDRFELPGMAVLQFAFGDPASEYLPHNYRPRLAAYTGTHDNDTIAGWWRTLDDDARAFARRYLRLDSPPRSSGEPGESVHWAAVRAVLASVANLAVVPLQDVLGLGSEARMNVPGEEGGNWAWRFAWDDVDAGALDRLRDLSELYGRTPTPPPPDSESADEPASQHAPTS